MDIIAYIKALRNLINRKKGFPITGKALEKSKFIDNCSNTTVNITTCIVLNISSDVLFYIMVHFVIIISISKVF